MTELIKKAIEKIDKEAEELGGGQVMIIASHIIDHYLTNDENANKVLEEKKTLKAALEKCKSNAKQSAVNGMAVIDDETVYSWIEEYYGFTDLQSPAQNKIVNLFDVL